MKILAAICDEPHGQFKIESVDLDDDLDAHEVLVRNVATGICHSDLSLRDAPVGMPLMIKPAVLGHEGSGIVERVGGEVTAVEPGDHVIMSFYYDGDCPNCRRGLHPYCDSFFALNLKGKRLNGTSAISSARRGVISASYHQQSSFATYSVATEQNVVKVDKRLPLEYLGPLGCGFLTGAGAVMNRIKPQPGSSFAMFGVGAVGFAAIHAAKQAGCETIVAVDLHQSRLDLAREFGATHLIDASAVSDTVAAVRAICRRGVNYAYEASGATAAMSAAIDSLAPGGVCILSGVVFDKSKKANFTPESFMTNKTVGGILMGHADMPGTIAELLKHVESGDFPIQRLITMYDFPDINQAVSDMERGAIIKAILRMPEGAV